MFQYEVPVNRLKPFVDSIGAICNEGLISFEDELISCSAVDAANVAMCHCVLKTQRTDGLIEELGLSIGRLKEIVDSLKVPTVTLEYDDELLYIKGGRYKYKTNTVVQKYIKRAPIDKVSSLQYPVQFTIKSSDLVEVFNAILGVIDKKAGKVSFTYDKGQLIIEDEENQEVSAAFKPEELTDVSVTKGVIQQQVIISSDYIREITRPLGGFDTCQITMGYDKPISILSEKEGASTLYVISCRVGSHEQ